MIAWSYVCHFVGDMKKLFTVVAIFVQLSAFSQDLTVANVYGPTTYDRYEELALGVLVQNIGTESAEPANLFLFLSTDDQFNPGDKSVDLQVTYPLAPGQEQMVNIRKGVDVDPGTYYLIVWIDYFPLPDANEGNNSLVVPNFVVTEPDVDLTLTSFSLDNSTYTQNSTIKPTYVLENLGSTNVGGFVYTTFFLSSDDQFDPSDDLRLYTAGHVMPLDQPDRIESDKWLTVPLTGAPAGNFYILAMVDYDRNGNTSYVETNENNNLFAIPIVVEPLQFALTGTVLGEDGSPITGGKLVLYRSDESGNLEAIETIDSYESPSFSFVVDPAPHALYFVPDQDLHPKYLATVYSKSPILQESNYFEVSGDMDITFEVLKVSSTETGTGIINGQLASESNPSGRVKSAIDFSTTSIPVILMSLTGQVIAVTHTDESGRYEFTGLPRDAYNIILGFEPESPLQAAPFEIDITGKNLKVDFTLTSDSVIPTASQLFLPQTLTFEEFASYQYGDAPIVPVAFTDTGLPIEYHSSDNSIATVEDGTIVIKRAGTVTITATQVGNDFYYPASVDRILTIDKASQTITFDAIPELTTETGSFTLFAEASSGLEVSFESSDESIVSIVDNTATIHQSGTVTIIARQEGNENYISTEVSQPVTIQLVLGIGEQDLVRHVYPNPTTDFVTVDAPELVGVEVFDNMGRIRNEVIWSDNIIDFTRTEAGVYLVKLVLPDAATVVRIVKK
jgi:hypothetical protein